MIPVVLGISFVVYAIISFTPGDPAQLILGADTDPAILAAKRVELGLNDPFLLRYLKYISGVFVGNLGNSYRTGLPVLSELLIRLPNTLIIALGGIGLSVIIGVPLGLVSAVKQYTFVDYFARTLALLLTAIPAFWLGLMLLLYFVLNLNLLPATGANSWKNFVLPIVTLAASAAATQT
ncbi:MAG: ABC transporter permease, partial [Sporomusa sp.]